MKESSKPFVNLGNARFDAQRQVMEDIAKAKECPFCLENLEKYHKEEVLRKGVHWMLTRNQWPYAHTSLHLLAIATYHAEYLADLRAGSFDELQGHMVWAEKEYNVAYGAIAIRFGDILSSNSGATVRHLHAHLIVPSNDKLDDNKVRFKIG